MIERDLEGARDTRHDLIVVGGGVYGSALALEAARRGLRPLVLERDDFGGGTSGNWLRILHGGLRYLQRADLSRSLGSVRERRWFLRHFPDLVAPLRCVMPLYGRGVRRRWIMATALATNDVLSWSRNRGVSPSHRLPPGGTLAPEALLRLAPSVRPGGLRGGAVWYDAFTPRPQRLLMAILRWAVAEGARASNYVEVRGLRREGRQVTGVLAHDRLSGRDLVLDGSVVVNCAGPGVAELAGTVDRSPSHLFRPSVAFNILLDREPDFEGALAVEAPRPGARTHFLYPAHGGILAGTAHGVAPAPGEVEVTPTMIDAFKRELGEALPGLALDSAPTLHVFAGRLPVRREGTVDLSRRAVVHHHGDDGGARGLVSVSGVKFTTARSVALRVLSELERRGQLRPGPESEHPRPPGPSVPPAEALGTMEDVEIGAVIRSITAEEAVTRVDDLLFRRTAWGLDARTDRGLRELVDRELDHLGRSSSPEAT